MRFTRENDFDLPLTAVRCPFCSDWVTVDIGAVENLWLHEYECAGILMDWELAPCYEAPAREVVREEREPARVPLAA